MKRIPFDQLQFSLFAIQGACTWKEKVNTFNRLNVNIYIFRFVFLSFFFLLVFFVIIEINEIKHKLF